MDLTQVTGDEKTINYLLQRPSHSEETLHQWASCPESFLASQPNFAIFEAVVVTTFDIFHGVCTLL